MHTHGKTEEMHAVLEKIFQEHNQAQSNMVQLDNELAKVSIQLHKKRNKLNKIMANDPPFIITLFQNSNEKGHDHYKILHKKIDAIVQKETMAIQELDAEHKRLSTSRSNHFKQIQEIDERIRIIQRVTHIYFFTDN